MMCGCSLRTPTSNDKAKVFLFQSYCREFPDYANLINICLEEVSSSTSSHTNVIFKEDFLVYNLQDGFLTV